MLLYRRRAVRSDPPQVRDQEHDAYRLRAFETVPVPALRPPPGSNSRASNGYRTGRDLVESGATAVELMAAPAPDCRGLEPVGAPRGVERLPSESAVPVVELGPGTPPIVFPPSRRRSSPPGGCRRPARADREAADSRHGAGLRGLGAAREHEYLPGWRATRRPGPPLRADPGLRQAGGPRPLRDRSAMRRWASIERAFRVGLRLAVPPARRTKRDRALPMPPCTNRIFTGGPAEALVAVSAGAGLPVRASRRCCELQLRAVGPERSGKAPRSLSTPSGATCRMGLATASRPRPGLCGGRPRRYFGHLLRILPGTVASLTPGRLRRRPLAICQQQGDDHSLGSA